MLTTLWSYRGFVFGSIRNEWIARFSGSTFGVLWLLIQPLVQVATFSLILSHILTAKLPGTQSPHGYALYLLAGTIGWSLFSEILNRSLGVFIENSNLLKKISFPRVTLPIIVTGSALVQNILLTISIMIIFSLMGESPTWIQLWLFPVTLITLMFSLGIGLILGVLNVFLRDVGQIVPVLLQIIYWFTPIVYPKNIIPEPYREWLDLNPLTALVDSYHAILVYHSPPDWISLLPLIGLTLLSLGLGLILFRKASGELVDQL